MNFDVSAPILTSKLPVPLPHLLFTLSLITATLCTTNFQNLNQIVFRLFRTVLPGLWLRLPNSVTSFLFSNLYISLKSTKALNINFFLLPIKLLPLLNLLICTAWSLFSPSCYSLICCHPVLTDHLHLFLEESPIANFAILISEINIPSHSVSLAQNTLLMMSHSLIRLPPAHHSHPLSHMHCFIPGSKLTVRIFGPTLCFSDMWALRLGPVCRWSVGQAASYLCMAGRRRQWGLFLAPPGFDWQALCTGFRLVGVMCSDLESFSRVKLTQIFLFSWEARYWSS